MSPDKGRRRRTRRTPASQPSSGRRTDPGPPYIVRWHPEAEDERDASWPAAEIVAIQHAADKLQALGPRLGAPHSSAVQGTGGRGLRELRPRGGRARWRPIYRQATPSMFVILSVAPEAEIDQRGFDAAVDRAKRRWADVEAS